MTPSHTTRKCGQRYRYYTCVHAQKNGWQSCPSQAIPAQPIEQLVIEGVVALGPVEGDVSDGAVDRVLDRLEIDHVDQPGTATVRSWRRTCDTGA